MPISHTVKAPTVTMTIEDLRHIVAEAVLFATYRERYVDGKPNTEDRYRQHLNAYYDAIDSRYAFTGVMNETTNRVDRELADERGRS